MPPAEYTEVITGPARRASAAGRRLSVEPAWLDDRDGMTRNDVIDLVMLVCDSVARCSIPSPA